MSSIATCIKKHCPKERKAEFAEALKGYQEAQLADKIDPKEARIKAVDDALAEYHEEREKIMAQVRAAMPKEVKSDQSKTTEAKVDAGVAESSKVAKKERVARKDDTGAVGERAIPEYAKRAGIKTALQARKKGVTSFIFEAKEIADEIIEKSALRLQSNPTSLSEKLAEDLVRQTAMQGGIGNALNSLYHQYSRKAENADFMLRDQYAEIAKNIRGYERKPKFSQSPAPTSTETDKEIRTRREQKIQEWGFEKYDGDNERREILSGLIGDKQGVTFWNLRDSAARQGAEGGDNRGSVRADSFRLAEQTAKAFGKETRWTTFSDASLDGIIVRGGKPFDETIFLNPAGDRPAMSVLGHELTHWMKTESPKIYQDLYDAVGPMIASREQYAAWRDDMRGKTAEEIDEEILADLIGDHFSSEDFWRDVAIASGETKFRAIANKIRQWLSRVIRAFEGKDAYGAETLVTDLKATRKHLIKATADYASFISQSGKVNTSTAQREVKTSQASLADLSAKQRSELLASVRNGGYNESINPYGLRYNDAQAELAIELEEALGWKNEVIPWSLPKSLVRRDSKGRVQLVGVSRNGFETAERIAKVLGKRIVWANLGTDYTINGLVIRGGRFQNLIFIDPRAERPYHVVYGHELAHHLEKEHPQAYKELTDIVYPLLQNIPKYRSRLNLQSKSDEYIRQEIVSDLMGDAFADPSFWNEVAAQAPGTFRSIANKIREWINGIINRLTQSGFGSDEYTKDLKATRKALAQLIAKTRNEKGRAELAQQAGKFFSGDEMMSQQQAQFNPVDTASANFKAWFGDSVITENGKAGGKPLVVYHGTTAEFEEFSVSKTKFQQDQGAIFFTDSEGVAEGFADGDGEPRVIKSFLSLQNPLVVTAQEGDTTSETWDYSDGKIAKDAKEGGYDGVVIRPYSDGESLYVAFRPEQVKSADKNTGDFSKSDPRIKFSVKGATSALRENFKHPTTEAFKKWFGKSKITSSNKPHVLYHGTNDTRFLQDKEYPWVFDLDRATRPDSSPFAGLGIFLGNDTIAMAHSGGNPDAVHPVYVRVENPLVVTSAELERKVTDVASARALRKRAMEIDGYDGIIIKDRGQVVAFEPNQVKSARENSGEFSRGSNDIRYSIGGTSPLHWDSPLDSKKDTFLYNAQNKFIDLFRVQDAIKRFGGTIEEETDVVLAEELWHKRAAKRVDDFLINEVKPLMNDLGKVDKDEKGFEKFLHARHAEEANESLRKRNPNATELKAMQDQALADRDRLKLLPEVEDYIKAESELAVAQKDVELGNADDSLIDTIRSEMAVLARGQNVQQYIEAREKHKALRGAKPYNGDNTWLSGMKTADATQYIDSLAPEKRAQYEALAVRWDSVIAKTRATLVEYGLESQETVDSWADEFDFYIPLNREDMDGGKGIGQGVSIRGSSTKARTGSTKKVVDILANVVMQREKAIVRGEKATISKALYGLAAANPNEDFWTIETPVKKPKYDVKTGIVQNVIDPSYKNRPNVVVTRLVDAQGKIEEKAVVFNERNDRAMRMAEALKNLDTEQLGAILGASAKVTRFFSAMNTQYNIVFGAVNLTRDIGGMALNLTNTPLAGKQASVLKRVAKIIPGLYKAVRAESKGNNLNNPIANAWREMQLEGGTTGFRDMFEDSAARGEALRGDLLQVHKKAPRKFFEFAKQWVSNYNDVLENSTRLAVYMEAKEAGMSNKRAAQQAKNITINFNRKGKVATQAGAMYAFFNAAVQGTDKLYKTMTGPAGKRILAGGLLLGSAQALLLAAAGFDDEEPPEFVRERNIIIPIGGKRYISIPMPLGFHVIPNLARVPTEWALSGFKDTGKRVVSLSAIFAESFNPIGNAGFSVQSIAPTPIDPFIALSENKDWTGSPIARQDFNTLKPTPGHSRAKDTASMFGHGVSRALNFMTGGNEYVPGLLSPTPDQIDYLVGQAFGGVGREGSKAFQTAQAAVSGESLPAHKIPFVGRYYGNSNDTSGAATLFYNNIKKMGEHDLMIDGLRENGGNVAEYLQDNPDARYIKVSENIYKQVQKLQKEKRRLLLAGAEKSRIEGVEKTISTKMEILNNRLK